MIVNSSQGGGSKDTWVLEEDADAPPERARRCRSWSPPRMPGLPLGGAWSSQQQQQQQ